DEAFVAALKEFLRWKYRFVGTDNGQQRFTIRSTSLSLKKLRKYTEILKEQTHLFVDFEKISSVDKVVPETDKFPKYGYGGRAQPAHLQEENRRRFHFKPPYPLHLSEISNIPPSLKAGLWYA